MIGYIRSGLLVNSRLDSLRLRSFCAGRGVARSPVQTNIRQCRRVSHQGRDPRSDPHRISASWRPFGVIPPASQQLPSEKTAMESLGTADLCDAHMEAIAAGDVRALLPAFQAYGKRREFSGPIATVKVFEDNVLVRDSLAEKGEGKVLFVDGGGSLRCALLGGNLAAMAQDNGWAGIVVNGCVRDVDEINACVIGVRALASHPMKSLKKGEGDKNVVISFGGARVSPGEWCYVDSDGIVVSKQKLSKL